MGDYFVNFAFAAAGRSRGGPAKVAIFASGLMGMINGTSAGNVVATGSLTIPLMKKVGYKPTTAGAVEAAASTGGQIMPPIMGAGAFIMAEITGIPYTDIAIAAIIPAVLYFVSIYFMVDFEAAKLGMRGMREDELPKFRDMVTAGVPVPADHHPDRGALHGLFGDPRRHARHARRPPSSRWLTPYRMGPRSHRARRSSSPASCRSRSSPSAPARASSSASSPSPGVGARFSTVLLGLADATQLLALFFAMCISILLGMGMPTTAAYAVAASVVAPGLVQLGIPQLTAHFFVFYFAVVSAITPPVALASYAAAGISGANPMATSVASFKIGISGLHRAVHVLLQRRDPDGRHLVRDRPRGPHGDVRRVPPVLGGAGLVGRRARGLADPDRPDRGRAVHDRGRADLRHDRDRGAAVLFVLARAGRGDKVAA